MPNVTSSEGQSQYYRDLSEMQEEYKLRTEQNKKLAEEREARIEENARLAQKRQAEQTSETLDKYRETAQADLSSERELNRSQMNQLRATTYDKYGKYFADSVDEMRDQYKHADEAWNDRHRNDSRILAETDARANKRAEELNQRANHEVAETARVARDASAEGYRKLAEANRASDTYEKKEREETSRILDAERLNRVRDREERTNDAIADTRRVFDARVKSIEEGESIMREKQRQAYTDSVDRAVRDTDDSRTNELKGLREQAKVYTDLARGEIQKRNETRAAVIRDVENDHRVKERVLSENYQREFAKLKSRANQIENDSRHDESTRLGDLQRRFAETLGNQNIDANRRTQDLENTFRQNLQQRDHLNQTELARKDHARDEQAQVLLGKSDEALRQQSVTFNEHERIKNQNQAVQTGLLEQELRDLKDARHPNELPAGVADHVRASVESEYEKKMQADVARNQAALEHVQQNYSSKTRNAIQEGQSKLTQMNSTQMAERHAERKELMGHLEDLEFQKDVALREKTREHDQESERTNRIFATSYDQQRREYEDLLQGMKNENATRLHAFQQDAEFKSRMAQRAFNAQQNETIRSYEKKLADQRADYTNIINDLKGQTSQQVREAERRGKQALEEQGRTYEQKIAQTEAQTKEREARAAQVYQDELEKVRRANSMLISKK